jgi:hypothetical protein
MNEGSRNEPCGCLGASPPARVAPGTAAPGPAEAARRVRVRAGRQGRLPLDVVLSPEEATPERLRLLGEGVPDLPRLGVGPGEGAIDLRLENVTGKQVKEGAVLLEGPGGRTVVAADPTTRRFRRGALAAGRYTVLAASAEHGRGTAVVEVRAGDVTRAAVPLDGRPAEGHADLRLAVRGATGESVEVRVTDRRTNKEIYRRRLPVADGLVRLEAVPLGAWHLDVRDDSGATSCYDLDGGHGDIVAHIPSLAVELDPRRLIDPNPPDPARDPLFGLSDRYSTLVKVLPALGVRSIRELAALEGEDLMHRLRGTPGAHPAEIPAPVIGGAVLEARALMGQARVAGAHATSFTLAPGGGYRRAFLPAARGQARLRFDLPDDAAAEVTVAKPSGTERTTVRGAQSVAVAITDADLAASAPIEVSVRNTTARRVPVRWASDFPAAGFVANAVLAVPTTRDNIGTIYRAWAASNPGVSPDVLDTSLDPENVRGWLDRARSLLALAGVCSLNDLGTLRMQPSRVLRPGAYVAPAKPPAGAADVPVLTHYAFEEIISGSVVRYRPNDTLHETAVVIGGAWDIHGQTVMIGADVRELTVIVRSIQFDDKSRITWERPELPGPRTYFPAKAARGGDGAVPGERGHDGAAGDPHPANNGGANADQDGPIVTMYVLETKDNLPPIDLKGQDGGPGGRGQDGGDGGNGATGEHADSHFFSGCCRPVGWGGDGGNGGAAGRGGQGGRGGRGGRLTLLTSEASIAALAGKPPQVDVNPGAGGAGGPAGNPGLGGKGGEAGSADCELWCPSHPERHGKDGVTGPGGAVGRPGERGHPPPSDAPQIYPLTEAQWNTEFNQPHILQVSPTDAEPGETVTVTGQNFQPGSDRVYFDGVPLPAASSWVFSSTLARFAVPLTAEGGTHPVVIRPEGVTSRRSNHAMVRVLPKLDAIAPGTRWVAGQALQLTGLAFSPGCGVVAEDWSVNPHPRFTLGVTGNTRTVIDLTMPAVLPNELRGVRRILVRNPDGGTSRGEFLARLGDTIVVNVAAFRVVGTTPGTGSPRSEAEIAGLFVEGGPNSVSIPWAPARVVFRLVQPVKTVIIDDLRANTWPKDLKRADEVKFAADNGGVPGALNVFFFRDLEKATAHAWLGGGPILYGEEPGHTITAVDFYQIVAHEIGHALCLQHVCPNEDEAKAGTATFFNRACQAGDEAFLMYPHWDKSDSMQLPQGQIDQARTGATHVEQGRIHLAPDFAFPCGTPDSAG